MSDAIESLMRALQQQCAAVAPASGPEDGSKCGTGDSSQNDFATPPTPKSPHFPGMLNYFFRKVCLENYTCVHCDSHIFIPVQSCHYSSANSRTLWKIPKAILDRNPSNLFAEFPYASSLASTYSFKSKILRIRIKFVSYRILLICVFSHMLHLRIGSILSQSVWIIFIENKIVILINWLYSKFFFCLYASTNHKILAIWSLSLCISLPLSLSLSLWHIFSSSHILCHVVSTQAEKTRKTWE